MKPVILLSLLLFGSLCADEVALDKSPIEPVADISAFPDWDFCVAYNFRDADERDRRANPFSESEPTIIPRGSLLIPVYMFDTAGLVSRTVSQKMIEKEPAKKVFDVTLRSHKGKRKYPPMDCYDPHHLVVFYAAFGIPVGCIEVCFTCNEAKIYFRKDGIDPALRVDPLNQPDFLTIATIFDKAGVPLLPFKSLDSYRAHINKQESQAANIPAEEDGARQPTTPRDSKSEGNEKPKPEPEGRSQ